ncbi:transposase [Campylobacter troglodytis]|uniref:transposase n=1 Tax=Campylobacter troglodytis TaxID=654363 RepID=UPI001157D322|nr:transposase [Campylobacter troglodytis]TQR60264.1 hypothetical protein DMC01_06390 [Campylobacter troglodytis]
MRGKRGRGAGKKTPVFLLRATRLVTASKRLVKTQSHEFIRSSTCSAKELLPIIKDVSELEESEIYSDKLKAYGALVDFLLRFVLQLCSRRSKVTGSNTLNSSLQTDEIISTKL